MANEREPKSSEITPEATFARRREFLKNSALLSATAAVTGGGLWALSGGAVHARRDDAKPKTSAGSTPATAARPRGRYDTDEAPTSWDDATTYNNYYEFGTDKADPARTAGTLKTRPWTVVVEGDVTEVKFISDGKAYVGIRMREDGNIIVTGYGTNFRTLLDGSLHLDATRPLKLKRP